MSGVFLFGSCVLLCPPMCPDCSPPSLIFNLTSMERDVRDYVANCSISARSQSNSQQPSGLLKPLVTPHRSKLLWTSLPGYPSPLHNRPVLKVRSFCCSSEITHCSLIMFQAPWHSAEDRFGQGSSVHLPGLEDLHCSGSQHQPQFQVSPADRRPDQEAQSRVGIGSVLL